METSQNADEDEGRRPDNTLTAVDIGVNLTHRAFRNHWRNAVRRAIDAGVTKMILTGTCIESSRRSLRMAQEWLDETGRPNLLVTVGVHPHDAKTFHDRTLDEMRGMLGHPLAVAVGECGLDFNRNFSSPADQVRAFREQVRLAIELDMPLFLHEREAHGDLIGVLDEAGTTPPIVVHCFTGTREEAAAYVSRGYSLGFTGTVCKKERGAPLRELLPSVPLGRIMVETDAPFMGFKRGRRSSEPADCVDVAGRIAETIGESHRTVCETTTGNALRFFQIANDS